MRYSLTVLCFCRARWETPGSCKLDAWIRLETLSVPSNASHGPKGKVHGAGSECVCVSGFIAPLLFSLLLHEEQTGCHNKMRTRIFCIVYNVVCAVYDSWFSLFSKSQHTLTKPMPK